MARADCPCGFPPQWGKPWRVWHSEHALAHLAAFPDVDERTRRVLQELVDDADKR